jgi:hypothetical protein
LNLLFLLPVLAVVAVLAWLFLWSLRPPRKSAGGLPEAKTLELRGQRHATHCAQIRQALSRSDFEYLAGVGGGKLARQVSRERRRVALAYLEALRGDFYGLLRLGRVIAKLSPEVVAIREFERLRLAAQFIVRSRMIELRLLVGMTTPAQIGGLSDLVSYLAVRMEAALKELGERAAKAAELAHPSTGAV